MSPRRKTSENQDMPTGLSPVKLRGTLRFRYRYPDGKDIWFPKGTTRKNAIDAALKFNMETRNPTIKLMERTDKYNRPISYWLPKVIERVRKEEKLSKRVLENFLSNCSKLLEQHGRTYTKSIDLELVNDFLKEYAKNASAESYNRKIAFLRKVFTYLVDMSAMPKNFAEDKKTKRLEPKKRLRLKLEDFQAIHASAPTFLKVAMELAIQTTHATLEISRLKYRHCTHLAQPELIDGQLVYGYVRIHRQKVHKKESSRVEIPITAALKSIIDESRDKIHCPYIVHRIGKYRDKLGEGCDHPFQVSSKYISKAFSKVRDEIGLYSNLDKLERPSFHEIRALSIHMYTQAGIDPQSRAAHADAKSTKIYQENHVEWVRVPAGELAIS